MPSISAISSVEDNVRAVRLEAGGGANRPCSRRLDQMKNPPCSKPRTLTIVRRRLTNTYQRPSAGLRPRWPDSRAHSPSKLRRMSAGPHDSQMPPRGQPRSITTAEPAGRPRRPVQARRPSRKPRVALARRRNPSRPRGGDGTASSLRSSATDVGIRKTPVATAPNARNLP